MPPRLCNDQSLALACIEGSRQTSLLQDFAGIGCNQIDLPLSNKIHNGLKILVSAVNTNQYFRVDSGYDPDLVRSQQPKQQRNLVDLGKGRQYIGVGEDHVTPAGGTAQTADRVLPPCHSTQSLRSRDRLARPRTPNASARQSRRLVPM